MDYPWTLWKYIHFQSETWLLLAFDITELEAFWLIMKCFLFGPYFHVYCPKDKDTAVRK